MNNSEPKIPRIAILGTGCAGLAAGWRLVKLGYPVILLEKSSNVGGLAGGVRFNKNIYEYGPHIFHTTDPEISNDIKSLMNSDLKEINRTIKIKFFGDYFKFPLALRDVLLKLPPGTVIRAALSFIWHFVSRILQRPPIENSETVLKQCYGDVLYQLFFKSYITRVWGISPSEFSPAFARERIPRLNLLNFPDKALTMLKNRFKHRITTDNYVEKVEGMFYTTRHGFSLIAQRMADEITRLGGQILLNAEVKRIFREGDKIKSVEFLQNGVSGRIEFDGVINTLSLNEVVRMVCPAFDNEILQSAKALKFRALVFVGLLVRRPIVLSSSFMYFREHSFNRVSDFAHFGFDIQPKGHTILIAEISCDISDRVWTDDKFAKEVVLADLVKERLIKQEEIVEMLVFHYKHAYPIYTLNYEHHRVTLLNAIGTTDNMETAGRQGRFQYVNTHVAIKMGYEAADRLIKKWEEKIKN